jgi:IS5 family transposase
MNLRKHTKGRAELSWRHYVSLHRIDDDTQGLWAKKRADQARCREQVRSGKRTPESMLLISPTLVREMRFKRRSDEF